MAKTQTQGEIIFYIILYSICSSSMLVVNKLAMKAYPVPAVVSIIQLSAASVFCYVLKSLNFSRAKVDNLEWSKMKPYSYFVIAFACGLYTNMRALEHSSVGTITVFRACTPIATIIVDWMFLGRELPTFQSAAALLVIVFGAYNYVVLTGEFKLNGVAGFFWVIAWYILVSFQMCYGNSLQKSVDLEKWGSVYYQNFLSVPMTFALGFTLGDFEKIETAVMSENALFWIVLSSFIGIAIGFASWSARASISSTSYTLVGVMNKMVSIMWSVLYIDTETSVESLAYLSLCIIGGMMYRQSPMRKDVLAQKAE